MGFALWIGRHKVYTAAEIAECFDLASVRGYFLGGTLIDWLRENGGEAYADRLDMITKDSPTLNEDIAAVFGVKEIPESVMNGKGYPFCVGSSFYGSHHGSGKLRFGFGSFYEWEKLLGQLSSFGSYRFGSGSGKFHEWEWEWLLGHLGSFGSFSFGSGSGRFHEWEWEWLLGQLGSFGSFSFGSGSGRFHEWEWEWLLGQLGSFGSYRFGSGSGKFHEWEWEWLLGQFGSFGSFRFGSGSGKFHEWEWEWLFEQLGSFGSFKAGSFGSRYPLEKFGSFSDDGRLIDFFEGRSFDDYDLIMLSNLIKCPLNGYGYGIHNI